MPWSYIWILLIVSALLCAVGFYKYVYFLSIGYGFAISGCGIAIFIMYLIDPTATPLWIVIVQMLLFLIYGIRLSGFLLYRELKNSTFRKTDIAKDLLENGKKNTLPIFVSISIWVCVAILYVAQVSPMLFRFYNSSDDTIIPVIGFIVSVFGIVLESMADKQKSAQKKERPDMVATRGLYKLCRCPNYFGEILFWTGVFISGITTYATIGQWISAVAAYICIVFIMFNGAQRLEKRQMARYGTDEEYNSYADKTPIIIPFLPIYHLNKK